MRRLKVLFAVTVVILAPVLEGTSMWRPRQRLLCSHWYNWPWKRNGASPYSTKRISQMRTLVGSCEVDIGACPLGSCSIRTKYFDFCPHHGYVCPVRETRTADCGVFGKRIYEYVSQCRCCKNNVTNVIGVVKGTAINAPLQKAFVYFDDNDIARNGENVQFKSTINSSVRSVVVATKDKRKQYMNVVKTVNRPEDLRSQVEVEFLLKNSKPVEIESTVDTVLFLYNDPLDPNAGNTVITIQANSFKDGSGRPYNGKINARITFTDKVSNADAVDPGQFQTLYEDTTEPLIRDGVASVFFESTDGQLIKLFRPVKFTEKEGMNVWELDTRTGLLEAAKVVKSRRKRQLGHWYDIDKFQSAARCYFKGRIFNETSGNEIMSSVTSFFSPEIIASSSTGKRLRLYAGDTSEPSTTCYKVICPNDPDEALTGFIRLSATEVISVGGKKLSSRTYLNPREFLNYNANIKPTLAAVQYKISPNSPDISIKFVSNTTGPFYRNRNVCKSSSETQSAFHFFKSEPPSYEPGLDNSEICTARIAFKEEWNFYNYPSNFTNSPNVTGISIWEQDGSNFYFIDVAQMEFSRNGNEAFIFICLKYRCSQGNETTTVYLDIDIPTVNLTSNYTNQNGFVVNYTYTQQEFGCYGHNVKGSLFSGEEDSDDVASIEGSFIAPENIGSGPDFYDSKTNDCKQEADTETFAYEFNCYIN